MINVGPEPDPVGRTMCSRGGCTADATWGMVWNNPKVHTPERRKIWLTCDEHHEYFRLYLSSRNFLKQEVPIAELEHKPEVEEGYIPERPVGRP